MSRRDGVFQLDAWCPDCGEVYSLRAVAFDGRFVFSQEKHGRVTLLTREDRRGDPFVCSLVRWFKAPGGESLPAPWVSVPVQ